MSATEGVHLLPEHDPLVLAARLHLQRHLTTVLDGVDMPEPVRTAVVERLLDLGGIENVACPEVTDVDGKATPVLVHYAALEIRHPYPAEAVTR